VLYIWTDVDWGVDMVLGTAGTDRAWSWRSGLIVGATQAIALGASLWIGLATRDAGDWWRVAAASLLAGAGLALQERRPGQGSVLGGRLVPVAPGVAWSPAVAAVIVPTTAGVTLLVTLHLHGPALLLAIALVAVPGLVGFRAVAARQSSAVREVVAMAEVETAVAKDAALVTLTLLGIGGALAGVLQSAGAIGPVNLLAVPAVGAVMWVLATHLIRKRRY
jgi:hypothetical protein